MRCHYCGQEMDDGQHFRCGTWAGVTRSTEEEHQKFMKALNNFYITEQEFIAYGPDIIYRKFDEFMKEMGWIKDEPSLDLESNKRLGSCPYCGHNIWTSDMVRPEWYVCLGCKGIVHLKNIIPF